MKDYNSQLKKILQENKLEKPLPREIREYLLKNRKSSLINILKKNNRLSIYTRVLVSIKIFLRNTGLRVPKKNKILSIKGLSFAFAGLVLIIGIFFIPDLIEHIKPGEKAFIIYSGGQAEIQLKDRSIEEVKIGKNVYPGDMLMTGADSTIIIQIGNRSMVIVQENSTIKISSLFDNDMTDIYLQNGAILSKVIKINKNSRFRIKTRNMIATALGTEFGVSFSDGVSGVTITKGRVHIKNLNGAGEVLPAGNSAAVSEKINLRPITDFEILNLNKLSKIDLSPDNNDIDTLKKNSIIIEKQLRQIDKKILNDRTLRKRDNTNKKITDPLEILRKKYGRIVRIITKDGNEYTGAFRQAGKQTEIITPQKRFMIDSTQIMMILTY